MHNVHYADYPENVNKYKVQKDWDNYAAHEDWQEGRSGLPTLIEWRTMSPFASYNEAYDWINEHDSGRWYWQVAVRYREAAKKSKAMEDLDRRISETEQKKVDYANAHSVKTFKSELIGCKKCGSKLARTYLKGERCPLCGEDLRGDTTLKTLAGYDQKLKELRQKLKELRQKREEENKKNNAKGEVRWLVKIEYHT